LDAEVHGGESMSLKHGSHLWEVPEMLAKSSWKASDFADYSCKVLVSCSCTFRRWRKALEKLMKHIQDAIEQFVAV
jgi:hypothetical protein